MSAMNGSLHTHVPFAVVGVAALVGLAVTPPPPVDGQQPGLGRTLADVERGMSEALRDLESKKARRDRLEAEIEGLAEQQKAVEARLAKRSRALYRLTRAGMLPLAGGFPALLEHVGRLQRMEGLVSDDLQALQSLQTRSVALREEAGELEAAIERTQARFDELRSTQSDLERHRASADRFEQTFRKSTFDRRQAPAPSYGGIRVLDEPPTGLESDFGALKGRLAMPVTGDFRMRDARGGEGPALRFTAAPGATVRAAAEGRVAFSDQHGDYGRLIIVDHGDNYYTVYGGLGGIDVRVGDYVGTRARLGSVASGDGLLFEVRRGTRSLPPRAWLGY